MLTSPFLPVPVSSKAPAYEVDIGLMPKLWWGTEFGLHGTVEQNDTVRWTDYRGKNLLDIDSYPIQLAKSVC